MHKAFQRIKNIINVKTKAVSGRMSTYYSCVQIKLHVTGTRNRNINFGGSNTKYPNMHNKLNHAGICRRIIKGLALILQQEIKQSIYT